MDENFNLHNALEKLVEKLSNWGDSLILKLPNLVLAILAFAAFWFAAKHTSRFIRKVLLKKVGQESIKNIIEKTIYIIIVSIGFFVALGILDLSKVLTSVLASAGIIGLAIGLALQGTLNNTFSGIILSFLPRVRIGDWVDTNGFSGRIVDINLRSIAILQNDNNYVLIPNSKIIDEPIKNYTLTKRSRIIVPCGVGYESDLEFVRELVIKTLKERFPQEEKEEVELFYTEFGSSSINFIARFWIDTLDNRDLQVARSEAILAIKKAFNENNINIPFPIRTLDFGKNKFRAEEITLVQKNNSGDK
jgi:small conductance mechanosensitive channel